MNFACTCPVCRNAFSSITTQDGEIINVKPPIATNHADEWETVVCGKCGRGDRENVLMMCDNATCENAMHSDCCGEEQVPEGPWFCSEHRIHPLKTNVKKSRPWNTRFVYQRVLGLARGQSIAAPDAYPDFDIKEIEKVCTESRLRLCQFLSAFICIVFRRIGVQVLSEQELVKLNADLNENV
jgi:hypothetical protein